MPPKPHLALAICLAGLTSACPGDDPGDDPGDVDAIARTVANPEEKSAVACALNVTADRTGLAGTTPAMAFDGTTSTSFRSSYESWQRLDIDYGCVGVLSGVRRYMSRNASTAGTRGAQGEGVAYSLDGVTWTSLSASTSTGWQGYVAYAPTAWHSVVYGWSAWLVPTAPVRARYIRFNWDGNTDALHDVQVQFAANHQPSDADLERGLRSALTQVGEASARPPRFRLVNGWPRSLAIDVAATGTDAVSRARWFLATYRGLYGLADPNQQLTPHRVLSRTLQHVRFTQRLDGRLVYGAELAVHLAGNRVVATTGAWLPYVPALPPARVTLGAAEARARTHLGMPSATLDGDTTQVYFNEGLSTGVAAPTQLAWRVVLRGIDPVTGRTGTWHVLVDAHSEAVLRAADQLTDKDFVIEDDVTGDDWFDEHGAIDYPGTAADAFLDGQKANTSLHTTWDFFANLGRQAWDGQDQEIPVLIHLEDVENAWYDSGEDQMFFGDDWVERDIFAHEYTHGVIAKTSNLLYQDQSGALNESYADVLGSLVDSDWIMPNIRSLSNPPSFSGPLNRPGIPSRPHPDHMSDFRPRAGAFDNGFVHINSGIPNKAGFLISDGGTHRGVTIAGIGRSKAARVIFETMIALPSTADFAAAATLAAANARGFANAGLHGFTMNDVCQVIRGYAAVGMGANDLDCDGFSDADDLDDDGDGVGDTVDNCPLTVNPLQTNTDGTDQGDACDADIDNDGRLNTADNCDFHANADQLDIDADNQGDVCDDDDDRDGVRDTVDNCPRLYNPDQGNLDGDAKGDRCDDEADGDGIGNSADNCPFVPNWVQFDSDGDGDGDDCDSCPFAADPTQLDIDRDLVGDVCDADIDADGLLNAADNCPRQPNPRQEDYDHDGLGLACDPSEQRIFEGGTNAELLRWSVEMDERPLVRIPIDPLGPCGGTCPPWLEPTFTLRVELRMEIDLPARIVDDRGLPVATAKPGLTKVMTFQPAMDLAGRRYFLELRRTADTVIGKRYTVDSNVRKFPNGL